MKMIRLYIFLSVMLMALLAAGCAKKPSPDDKVLVKVSNGYITAKDFKASVAKLPAYYRNIIEKDRKRYLEDMIAEKLFYEEALRRGLNYDKEIKEIVAEAKRKIVVARLVRDEVEGKIEVSDDEILAFYDANKDNLKTPEMWRASQILVSTEEEAGDVLRELKSGSSFEDIARAKSKDATASRGGDIGYFRTGQLVPDFEKAALCLNIGQVSDVVYTKFGYHLIKLTDKKEAGMQAYEKAKPLIENELKKKKKAEIFYDFIMALKKKYGVSIDEDAFLAVDASDSDKV